MALMMLVDEHEGAPNMPTGRRNTSSSASRALTSLRGSFTSAQQTCTRPSALAGGRHLSSGARNGANFSDKPLPCQTYASVACSSKPWKSRIRAALHAFAPPTRHHQCLPAIARRSFPSQNTRGYHPPFALARSHTVALGRGPSRHLCNNRRQCSPRTARLFVIN